MLFNTSGIKIKEISSCEWGINKSPEGLNKVHIVFFLTFNSREDKAIYLPHTDHKVFRTLLPPIQRMFWY
ncbi:Dabb family protein [uncultured Maribacter sp.]|uniref:Dabb family protein n=1 Tax=uncultured Maribacter sp. TaxID=431308 RepID=UPI00262F09CC|nr:Dabb family protein [uncultured Maribacter sp.]